MQNNSHESLIATLSNLGFSPKILNAFNAIDRMNFVHRDFLEYAYHDSALPIESGQTISQPSVMAMMMEKLTIAPNHKILEIGTGCGYQCIILSKLCARVYTMERLRNLLRLAEQNIRDYKCRNITTLYADGQNGWQAVAPFDRIIISACFDHIPHKLWDQLAESGKMILPLGKQVGEQELILITKIDGKPIKESLGAVKFVPIISGIK